MKQNKHEIIKKIKFQSVNHVVIKNIAKNIDSKIKTINQPL